VQRSTVISLILACVLSIGLAHAQFINLGPGGKQVKGVLDAVNGGTGQSAYTLGDTLYASGTTALSILGGNTSVITKYLCQTGDGVNSAAPAWCAIASGGYDTIQEEGVGLTQRTTLNFIGVPITCADNGGTSTTDCTAVAVTSVATSEPIEGGPITTTGTISCRAATGSVSGCLSAADWSAFNSKSGPATSAFGGLVGGRINSATATGYSFFGLAVNTSGGYPFPRTLVLQNLGFCTSAANTAGNVTALRFGPLDAANTLEDAPYFATMGSGQAAGCFQNVGPQIPISQFQSIRVINTTFGPAGATLIGWSAETVGAASQPTGAFPNASTIATGVTAWTGPSNWASFETATQAKTAVVVPFDATAQSLCLRTNNAQSINGTLVPTLMINGSASALTTSIAAAGAAGLYCDLTNTAAITAGDYIDWQVVNNGSATSAAMNWFSMDLVPSGTATGWIVFGMHTRVPSASSHNYFPGFTNAAPDSATEANMHAPAPRNFTAKNLYCYVNTAPASNTAVVTLIKNGAPTGLTLNITIGTTGVVSDLVNTVSYTLGDNFSLDVNLGAGAVPVIASCSMEVD